MTPTFCLAWLVSCSLLATPAENPRRSFVEGWQGARVIVTRPLYTVVYNEHGRLGRISRGERDGLTVVSTAGVFFRFELAGEEHSVTGRDPQEVFDRMRSMFGKAGVLDILPYQRIEPTVLTRYEPGVELLVRSVEIGRDRVRMVLASQAAPDSSERELATTLTIQWVTDLSESLGERPEIERLIGQFVVPAPR